MDKQRKASIDAADLQRFVEEASDFAFEMRVLSCLCEAGFTCSHSGTYQDPITGKLRQFDIRAERADDRCRLALAVECKNLRENAPLLLSAVPRTSAEAFHNILHTAPDAIWTSVREMRGPQSAYKPNEMVGKAMDQVRKDSNGILNSDDRATFEKMSQAVNSTRDLIARHSATTSNLFTAVVPVLIVPEGRLWQAEYSEGGEIQKQPYQLSKSTFFLDHVWPFGNQARGVHEFRLSHIDCLTISAFPDWATTRFGIEGLFPMTG
jgi:hypothetical protein